MNKVPFNFDLATILVCGTMNTPPIEYTLLALNLVARLIRLLYSFHDRPPGFQLGWGHIQPYVRIAFRFISTLMGIFILSFTVISLRQPLDILIYITIACESSLEVFTYKSSSFVADT
jgi:hypothetical protein